MSGHCEGFYASGAVVWLLFVASERRSAGYYRSDISEIAITDYATSFPTPHWP